MDILAADHEQVVLRHDRNTGLRAVIAIHDTTLGPAVGGCRHWAYDSESSALIDVLKLSAGMTFKNALADVPFGGGKSVILGKPGERLSEAMLEQFGRWIEELGGRYVTAEDVGMRVADMRVVARRTRYVSGLGRNGIGGDPSPATALGVFIGMTAAAKYRLGVASLEGLRVAIQGLGNVGIKLCRQLHSAGARLVVSDIDASRVNRAVAEFGARAVPPDAIFGEKVDVFAPCALGGILSQTSVAQLQAKVVAGSANNQLADQDVAAMLAARDVLYAPDFVINAGGTISVAAEYLHVEGYPDDAWVRDRIDAIPDRLMTIFSVARDHRQTTDQVAQTMAREVLARGPQLVGPDRNARRHAT